MAEAEGSIVLLAGASGLTGGYTLDALLAAADVSRVIAVTRRRLAEAVRALRDNGTVPPLVDDPAMASQARSGDLVASDEQPWLAAYQETLRQARHPELLAAAE